MEVDGGLAVGPVEVAAGGDAVNRTGLMEALMCLQNSRCNSDGQLMSVQVSPTREMRAPTAKPAMAEVVGGVVAFGVIKILCPGVTPSEAADVVVPHQLESQESSRARNR